MENLTPDEILIVVFHTRQEPWEEIVREGQFKTWVPVALRKGFRVAYCFGPKPNKFIKKFDVWNENLRWHHGARVSDFRNAVNRMIATPFRSCMPQIKIVNYGGAPEGVTGMQANIWDAYVTGRWRQLAIFRYFLNDKKAKYLVLLTSAAYIQPELLLKRISLIEKEVVYAGPFLEKDTASQFVGGAQVVINKKFAKLMIDNRKKIPVEYLNDLGLAFAAKELKVQPIELPSMNFSSLEELNKANHEILRDNYHFRLKSFKLGKRNDVELFHLINEILGASAKP